MSKPYVISRDVGRPGAGQYNFSSFFSHLGRLERCAKLGWGASILEIILLGRGILEIYFWGGAWGGVYWKFFSGAGYGAGHGAGHIGNFFLGRGMKKFDQPTSLFKINLVVIFRKNKRFLPADFQSLKGDMEASKFFF